MVSQQRKRELIRYVKKTLGIKFRYYFANLDYSAEVVPSTAMIGFALEKKQPWQTDTEEEFIGDILHEVVHIWCYRRHKFRSFHNEPRTYAQKRAYLRTAWRAEKWVDREAKRLAKEIFGISYRLVYKTKTDKKWFDKTILDPLREEWGFK